MKRSGSSIGQPECDTPIHASCIAIKDRGLLILGKSGSGKSGLALQLISLGAQLVADDRVMLARKEDHLVASSPPQLANKIEARGIGILSVPTLCAVQLQAAVTLDALETDRIPAQRHITLLDVALPLLHKVDMPSFPAALLQYLQVGTHDGAAL